MASTFGRSSIDCRKIRARFELFRHGLTQVRICFHETNSIFSIYLILQTFSSKTYIFVSICFVHRRNVLRLVLVFYALKCRILSELSDISRATSSQIGQSRFVHFILRCVIVTSHLNQIYCCFYEYLLPKIFKPTPKDFIKKVGWPTHYPSGLA